MFEAVLTARRPNPLLMGLSVVLIALALWSVVASVIERAPYAMVAPHLTIFGLVLLTTALVRRPWARLENEIVRANADGLTVGDLHVPGGQITRALYVPVNTAGLRVVRIERRGRPAVELIVGSDDEARRLLTALGHDVQTRRVAFRGWSPVLRSPLRFLAIPLVLAGFALSAVMGAPVPILAAILVVSLGMGVPSRIEVGADGVLFRWFGHKRFFAAEDIAFTETFVRGLGRNHQAGVVLHLRGGATYEFIVGSATWKIDESTAIATRIDDVIAAHRHGAPSASAALTRSGRSLDAWILALRRAGAGMHGDFRTAAVDRAQLWRVFENPASTPDERAAAAVALASEAPPHEVTRIRVTAEAVAEPALRKAITAATDRDDEALLAALHTLELARKG